jgi:hypothetical protein
LARFGKTARSRTFFPGCTFNCKTAIKYKCSPDPDNQDPD